MPLEMSTQNPAVSRSLDQHYPYTSCAMCIAAVVVCIQNLLLA